MTHARILHGTRLSGHTHRVQLFLHLLDLPYAFADSPADVRRSAAFRSLNPLGQIPVLQDGDAVLADSNAILVYLAKRNAAGTAWLPEDPVGAARVQRWLSQAAGEIMFGPAAARVSARFYDTGVPPALSQALAARVLGLMDGELAARDWLAADHPTIADVACYSYVAHAPEGGIALDPYPHVRAWIARVQALPGFVAMPRE
ncbi:glutathione S-transferase family protein [Massilia rhizosphaerae]|uniref:glutathione S-transferase family protein n=1 Tax=Massilia rhizosphaerae TaxID=2784389 RepID=UPI0018DEA5BD|nr:glutathione S-transferase [Massilia rhizosphaerae]